MKKKRGGWAQYTTVLQVRMSPEMREWLKEVARMRGTTESEIVRGLVDEMRDGGADRG